MADLNCLSLNVKGIRDKIKRKSIFKWCKDQKADVVFLQETHVTSEVETAFDLDWGGKGFHSCGTSKSRGVSIYFGPKCNVENIDVFDDNGEGRKILINCHIGDLDLTLVNIYAPNKVCN